VSVGGRVQQSQGGSPGPMNMKEREGDNRDRDRVRGLGSPKDLDGLAASARRQGRDSRNGSQSQQQQQQQQQPQHPSPKTRDRSASQVQITAASGSGSGSRGDPSQNPNPGQVQGQGQQSQNDQVEDPRGSPQYHTPLSTPNEHPSSAGGGGYTQQPQQYRRDSYQTPPASRKFSPDVIPAVVRATPPGSMKVRTPERDRSLPVQEEPEDGDMGVGMGMGERWVEEDESEHRHGRAHGRRHGGHGGRVHGGRDSRAGHREDDDDDETLIEQDSEDQNQRMRVVDRNRDEDEEEMEGYTPRSPPTNLPDEELHHGVIYGGGGGRQKHHRAGSTDQLGLRGIDPEMFVGGMEGGNTGKGKDDVGVEMLDEPRHYVQEPQAHHHLLHHHQQQQQQQQPPQYSNINQQPIPSSDQYPNYGRLHPPQLPHPHPEDLQSFFDDPASAFIQAYLSSPRPMAPIPPTPHSQTQTAAPSPSPLLSSVQPSPAPPVGSPYPYPFTHVRRSRAYAASPTVAASSSYDPNHPSVIQEQLALQMQMYALNNHAPVSESNFSPASTPYPGSGYNPWTFLQASRAFGGRRVELPHSMQSSPSHEPLALPTMPNIRGRGLKKRERSANLRGGDQDKLLRQTNRVPPPRVESTQPRETTPELSSSGEETSTAGEERFQVPEEGNWVNGMVEDDGGDWVDEEDEEDDLLDLECHPTYVSNVEKRRRRWETRWEALLQAFQALDWQTDATLVLLAAPSHSTKLHAVTSRSIRRDSGLLHSPSMSSIRTSFRHIAAKRRVSRANKISLADRLLSNSGSSAGGSDGSSESREEDLRRALQAALGSLGALGGLYDQREARWREEMRRISDDRETVELLLKQALCINPPNNNNITNSRTNGHDMGHAI